MSSASGLGGGNNVNNNYSVNVSQQDTHTAVAEQITSLTANLSDLVDKLTVQFQQAQDLQKQISGLGAKPEDKDKAKAWQQKFDALKGKLDNVLRQMGETKGKISQVEGQIESAKSKYENNLSTDQRTNDSHLRAALTQQDRLRDLEKRIAESSGGAVESDDSRLAKKKLTQGPNSGNAGGGAVGIGAGVP